MLGISFDPSINVGSLVTLIGFLIGGISIAIRIRDDVHSMAARENRNGERLDSLEREMRALADATLAIARQDERMNAYEHRLSALEHDARVARLSLTSQALAAAQE